MLDTTETPAVPTNVFEALFADDVIPASTHTFNADEGFQLKAEGMTLAARKRKEVLAAARQHLIDLALTRDDMCATADDAYAYIERRNLEPLGNAAGSLFKGKHWEFTGEYQASLRTSNHGHQNRVWRLRPECLK